MAVHGPLMDALALLVQGQNLKGAILVSFDKDGGTVQIKYVGDAELLKGTFQQLTHALMDTLKQHAIAVRF